MKIIALLATVLLTSCAAQPLRQLEPGDTTSTPYGCEKARQEKRDVAC